jgi:hypothetical protein
LSSKISLITATPPGYNPGMLAVELAAADFLRRHDLLDDSTFYRLMTMQARLAPEPSAQVKAAARLSNIGIRFETLESIEQLAGTIPVFWGDFLHMAQYIRALAQLYVSHNRFSQRASAEAYLREILLLDNAPLESVGRAVSFGSTLLFNNMLDSFEQGYWQAFARFSSNIKLFKVRDVFSAAQVRRLRLDSSSNPFGPDAAELLTRARLEQIETLNGLRAERTSETKGALIFIGRDRHDLALVSGVVKALESRLGNKFYWLAWGDDLAFPLLPSFRDFADRFPQAHEQAPALFFDALNLVQESSLILTDTYHLAVIGWTLGVPVLCLTGFNPDTHPSVNSGSFFAQRDKRFVFLRTKRTSRFFCGSPYAFSARHLEKLGGASMRHHSCRALCLPTPRACSRFR